MKRKQKMVLTYSEAYGVKPYCVKKLIGTVEWNIGQRFNQDEVQKILDRTIHPVEIEIVGK